MFIVFCSLFIVLCLCASLYAEDFPDELGDAAVAGQYLEWAEEAIGAGSWTQARAALERAMDFADVSSDIPYLLALARSHENADRGLIVQAVQTAIATNQWRRYTEAEARLLEADQLIILRSFSSALDTLAVSQTLAGETADLALLRLAALKGLLNENAPVAAEFRRRMAETLRRYPRDPRPLRILFEYAATLRSGGREPDREDIALVETAVQRLPFVVESDPELAWMAASFISNVAEARRLVAAYRAGSFSSRHNSDFVPNPASIAVALNLGLIDDFAAADELFAETTLDRKYIIDTGNLLRSEEGRDYFSQKILSFTGAIIEDADGDGYPESRAIYRQGSLQEYYVDTDQDGITDLYVSFIAGIPQWAELAALSSPGEGRAQALIRWERYPSVLRTEWGNETYLPSPGGFQFAPVIFEELGASASYAGLLFPRSNPHSQGINRRMLTSYAASIQRPSAEFEGGIERIFLERGVPLRAEVTLNDMVVSITEFENGRPLIQRLDIDMDGYMEIIRRFDGNDDGTVEYEK